jgi:hypothetical protein
MITISKGNFQNAQGTPAAGGMLWLSLSTDSVQSVSGGTVVAGVAVTFTLDSHGNVPSGSQIWSNAELTPATYYNVKLFGVNGALLLRHRLVWVFTTTTGGNQDLGAMTCASIPAGE